MKPCGGKKARPKQKCKIQFAEYTTKIPKKKLNLTLFSETGDVDRSYCPPHFFVVSKTRFGGEKGQPFRHR
jgi:hypothetical protein